MLKLVLGNEHEEFIRQQLAEGRHCTPSDVIGEALSLLMARQAAPVSAPVMPQALDMRDTRSVFARVRAELQAQV